MKTLKEQIDECSYEISQRQFAIELWKTKKLELLDDRAYCDHVWDIPLKKFEHEGRLCVKCGINDIYAETHHKLVEKKHDKTS